MEIKTYLCKIGCSFGGKPNAIWTMRGDELEWQDDNITKPTDAEIKKKYDELVAAEPLNDLRQVRDQKLVEWRLDTE